MHLDPWLLSSSYSWQNQYRNLAPFFRLWADLPWHCWLTFAPPSFTWSWSRSAKKIWLKLWMVTVWIASVLHRIKGRHLYTVFQTHTSGYRCFTKSPLHWSLSNTPSIILSFFTVRASLCGWKWWTSRSFCLARWPGSPPPTPPLNLSSAATSPSLVICETFL